MGEPTKARSRIFWAKASETERRRQEAHVAAAEQFRRVRFPSTAWAIHVSADGGPFEAKLTELSEEGVRLITPREVPRDAWIRVHVEDPDLHEVLECDATVASTCPPLPGTCTWIHWATFPALAREDRLRIAKWRMHYVVAKKPRTAV